MLSNDLVRLYTSCRRDQVCTHSRATNLIMIDHSSSSRYLILSEMFVTSKLAGA